MSLAGPEVIALVVAESVAVAVRAIEVGSSSSTSSSSFLEDINFPEY